MRTTRLAIGFLFGVVLALMVWFHGHVFQTESGELERRVPQAWSGDEPHYLVAVHALLFDHSLDLRAPYQRAAKGGPEAGVHFRGVDIDHHSVLFNPLNGHHVFWNSIIGPPKHRPLLKAAYPVEHSSHPIGFPALVAATLAPSRPGPEQVEERFSLLVMLVSWLAGIVTFQVGRRAGMSPLRALAAAMVLLLASPWLAYSRSFFSEPVAGLLLLGALGAMLIERVGWAAVALGAAFAIKPPYIVVALAWIIDLLRRRRPRDAIVMATIFGVLAGAIIVFDRVTAGSWLISGNGAFEAQTRVVHVLDNLFAWRYGLLLFAPWAILAWLGVGAFLARRRIESRLLRLVALPLVLYLGVLIAFAQVGSTCYGPRYWVPFLPWLALLALELAPRIRFGKPLLAVTVAAGVAIALPGGLMYPVVWDEPPPTALRMLFHKQAVAQDLTDTGKPH